MFCYDIVGWVMGCEIFCADCGEDGEDSSPVFACSEFDSMQHCAECGEEIDCAVLGERDPVHYHNDAEGV